jgi:hypothetical protein
VLIVVVVLVPVMSIVPTLVMAVPPAVVRAPAAFALGIQVAPPFLGLTAALAVFVNGRIESGFGALNLVLAFGMLVIRAQLRDGNQCHQAHSRSHHRRYSKSFKTVYFQEVLLTDFRIRTLLINILVLELPVFPTRRPAHFISRAGMGFDAPCSVPKPNFKFSTWS